MNEQASRDLILRSAGSLKKVVRRYLATYDAHEQAKSYLESSIEGEELREAFHVLRHAVGDATIPVRINLALTPQNRELLSKHLIFVALCQRFVTNTDIASLHDPQGFYRRVADTALDELRNLPSI